MGTAQLVPLALLSSSKSPSGEYEHCCCHFSFYWHPHEIPTGTKSQMMAFTNWRKGLEIISPSMLMDRDHEFENLFWNWHQEVKTSGDNRFNIVGLKSREFSMIILKVHT